AEGGPAAGEQVQQYIGGLEAAVAELQLFGGVQGAGQLEGQRVAGPFGLGGGGAVLEGLLVAGQQVIDALRVELSGVQRQGVEAGERVSAEAEAQLLEPAEGSRGVVAAEHLESQLFGAAGGRGEAGPVDLAVARGAPAALEGQ